MLVPEPERDRSRSKLRGIWPAPGKAWQVVGSRGLLLTFDGDASTPMSHGSETLRDISGGPDGSAFTVGNKGCPLPVPRWGVEPQDAGTPSNLAAVWTVSRNEAWAFAEDGGIFHGVGGVWQPEPSPPAKSVAYTGAVGLSDGGIPAVGMGSLVRRDATGWKQFDFATPTTPLNGVWHDSGLTSIVGSKGSIYREDGSTEPSRTSQTLHSVWSLGQKAWAVGEGGAIVHRTGSTWDEAPGGVTRTVRGLWAMADGLWAVGENRLIMRRVQNVWRPVPPSPEQSSANALFKAIWGSGDLLLVVEELPDILPRSSTTRSTCTRAASGRRRAPVATVNALWGTGQGQVWAVGGGGKIQRRASNGSWTEENYVGDLALNAIWGRSATDVWAGGGGTLGSIFLRDPSCTATAPTCKWNPQAARARRMPSSSPACGGLLRGRARASCGPWPPRDPIYHFDGTNWTAQSIDNGNPGLAAITGRNESRDLGRGQQRCHRGLEREYVEPACCCDRSRLDDGPGGRRRGLGRRARWDDLQTPVTTPSSRSSRDLSCATRSSGRSWASTSSVSGSAKAAWASSTGASSR